MKAKTQDGEEVTFLHTSNLNKGQKGIFPSSPINYTHMTELELKGGYGEHGRSCFLLKQENGAL